MTTDLTHCLVSGKPPTSENVLSALTDLGRELARCGHGPMAGVHLFYLVYAVPAAEVLSYVRRIMPRPAGPMGEA